MSTLAPYLDNRQSLVNRLRPIHTEVKQLLGAPQSDNAFTCGNMAKLAAQRIIDWVTLYPDDPLGPDHSSSDLADLRCHLTRYREKYGMPIPPDMIAACNAIGAKFFGWGDVSTGFR